MDKISAQHALDTTAIKDDISALKTEIQSVSDTQKHGELLNDVSQTNILHYCHSKSVQGAKTRHKKPKGIYTAI